MALPKIETPTYELKLPSKDETIAFRPFTVREEKILMIASESEKPDEVYNAITRMIDACTFNKIECIKLPLFDIEYIFLQIRSKSVGEVAKFRVVCPDDLETYAEVEVDISKVEVQVDDNHTNRIVLDESRNLGVVFAYPTMGVTKVGALNNRLESTVDNLNNITVKAQASLARIMDADFAKETTELSKSQVLSQAATAMLAQANQQPQNVLRLLQAG